MSTPSLHSSLVDTRIDDLRRTMAASRGRDPRAGSRSDRGRRHPAATNVIRAWVARLAR